MFPLAEVLKGTWRNALLVFVADVIWVILSVEVGGLLGVTQQLSSFQAEFNTQPHRRLEGGYNPFASPEKTKCPNSGSCHDAGGHKATEEHWQGSPDQLHQDQNGLSHSSVDLVANSLQSNLSVVSCNQVRHILGPGIPATLELCSRHLHHQHRTQLTIDIRTTWCVWVHLYIVCAEGNQP